MTELLGWVCLCGGLFGLAAAPFRWYESEFWVSMDWFDTHAGLDENRYLR